MNRGDFGPLFSTIIKSPSSHLRMTPTTSYKHLSIRNGVETVTEHYEPVTKHTRAGNNGKDIMCPVCGHVCRVYHFSWSASQCSNCKTMVNKYDYLVDQLDTWRTPR